MAQNMDGFIADLARLVARWKREAADLEAQGATALVPEIEAWIIEAERIIRVYEGTNA
jgi:anti-sigma-K factor RskA